MKEFFSKKWVFISSIALSAVFVLGMLIMLCVPQFYIGSYKYSATNAGQTVEQKIKFTSNKTMQIKSKINGEDAGEYECWYYRDGRRILLNGNTDTTTEAEFDEMVEELKAESKEYQEELFAKRGLKVNMFRIKMADGSVSRNGAAIAFFVIDLVLALASLAGAGYATWLYLKNKKAGPAVEEAEVPAEEAAE